MLSNVINLSVFNLAAFFQLVGRNRVKGVQHRDHQASGGGCAFADNFSCQSEIGESAYSCTGWVRVHCQKRADDRSCGAPCTGNTSHYRMTVSHAIGTITIGIEPSPRQAAGNLHRKDECLFSDRSLTPPQAARNALAIAVQ